MSSAGATYMTYSSLNEDVKRYIERGASLASDPTVYEQIPKLINGAERKIIQVLKLQGTIEVLRDATGFTPGKAVIAKPDRWRETVSFSYLLDGRIKTLFPRAYEYCTSYWPDQTEQSEDNPPRFYADMNYQNWLIAPTPYAVMPIEVVCYMQPPLLSESNQENFFTKYTPNMLLYGTLLEATPFIKNDERIPTWQKYWEFEIATLTKQDLQKILDRSADRSRP